MKAVIIQSVIFIVYISNCFSQDYSHRTLSLADFYFAKFDSEANFALTQFDSKADFSGAQFFSRANFPGTHFDSLADFYSVKFNSEAIFSLARFISKADFSGTQFDSKANFCGTQFKSVADFYHARFNSEVDFSWSKFDSIANFSETRFDSTVIFYGAQINLAYFSNAQFKSGISFYYLPKYLDFSNTKITGEDIDLFTCNVDTTEEYCLINLVNADIQKIRLRYSMFKLFFPKNTRWEIQESVYEQLLVKTNNEGFIKSYEKLDKEYKEAKYLNGYKKPKRLLNFIDKHWWGYRYNKEYIIRNSILIYLFFSIINLCILKNLVYNVYTVEKIKIAFERYNRSRFFYILFKLYYSLLYTGFIFFGLKFTIDNLNYSQNLVSTKILGIGYFIFMYISRLICLGYLANYIITV